MHARVRSCFSVTFPHISFRLIIVKKKHIFFVLSTNRFATRAKQVKNKPVVNEVVSEAVALKRMKKQIGMLEGQLADKEKTLKTLKGGLFNYRPVDKKLRDRKDRRRTWAPASALNFGFERKEAPVAEAKVSDAATDGIASPLPKSIFGNAREYTDEEFEVFLNVSFDTNTRLEDMNCRLPTPPLALLARPKLAGAKPSMLKTPKSLRRILNNERRTITPSPLASPIGFDKDKRIKALEEELEELRYFHQGETDVHNAVSEELEM